ncbi:AMP-binding protein [Mycobacterium sherrisii]|uniref:Phenazine antibiotic biosynthesis protein n=1 Tax=Mycobacterium sherrisii TaxID=243061 RepID=A0A1E3T4W8_9MYCO|nr:AMP-binding protein [Mycobacterium sherrisii]MCV7029813.1 AMP-binding protein [Mycobacterium sherrisii]MEC4762647.1 AMP-binding protein [Mycobacterium sherrisii]ODR08758.1 phenazine antibiotic biosynthesis protein [Mycobacterium sherrisii]ORW85100.1 phenazine antibiotic biosynthesis protein [Mycobacterium sherrisii]
MAGVDFSLLDVPRSEPIDDPDAYLRAAIAWHFGQDTGSAFWLRAAETLDFEPLTDVTTYEDLRRFPNLLTELRNVPIEDLIPRGYGSPPPVPQIFESGGTTGAPKRTAQLPDWVAQVIDWQTEDFAAGGFRRGQGFLCLMPSGPHGVGYFSRLVSERLGSAFHAIDIDPRWVKKIAAQHAAAQNVAAYVDHVLEQATYVLQTQNVANLHATPPLLEAMARNDDLVDLVNAKIRYLLLSGAHVDADTLDLLRGIFPDTTITMAFGSTMILSQAITRIDGDAFVFDPRTPYVVFWVIDPDTGEQVPYGQLGQVVMNHISKGMFLPNNLERDMAIRMPGPAGPLSDSVSAVRPVLTFEGAAVIEGVY